MVSESLRSDPGAPPPLLSTEYITVMVIILSFVVAVFSEQMHRNTRSEPRHTPAALKINSRPVDVVSMKRFFSAEGAQIHRRVVRPWAALLANHDLRVRAEINSGLGRGNRDAQWSMALARTVSLRRFLEQEGVPADAIEIVAVSRHGATVGRMKVVREVQ